MNPSFRETLTRIQEAESVAAVAVIDSDGMLVGSVPETSDELESLAASAGGMLSFLAALGGEAGLGEVSQATVEYGEGIVFLGPVTDRTFLLVLAERESPLGQVRLVLRRYRSELEQQLGAFQEPRGG